MLPLVTVITPAYNRAATISLDALVEKENLKHLDLIKMDIEGAELPALRGAEAAIRRFKPKLAVSIYHRLADFVEIPAWLDALILGYQFYIRHFTIHQEETILFAEVSQA